MPVVYHSQGLPQHMVIRCSTFGAHHFGLCCGCVGRLRACPSVSLFGASGIVRCEAWLFDALRRGDARSMGVTGADQEAMS